MNTVSVAAGSRIHLKNILYATDLSECANKALPHALSIARRDGAMVHAAYVVPADSALFYMSPADWDMIAKADERALREYVAALETQVEEVPHRVTTPKGNIPDALAKIIKEHEIDMLVVGTHGRSGVRKLLMGSVAENLFRRVKCPVLSIGPNVSGMHEPQARFRRILFATDFSQESLAALPYAISMADEDEARLIALHVVGEPAAGIVDLDATTKFLQRRLRDSLPPEANFWCHTECLIEFNEPSASPAERILQIAKIKAIDLIVLGVRPVHGEFGLATHLSSTTSRILTQAACPVLTVRG
jgi:nucleotide-binding universal stress UspA family protein